MFGIRVFCGVEIRYCIVRGVFVINVIRSPWQWGSREIRI